MRTIYINATDTRKNFFELLNDIADGKSKLIISKKGIKSRFVLKTLDIDNKRRLLRKAAGSWIDTDLDNDSLIKEIFRKKSRETRLEL